MKIVVNGKELEYKDTITIEDILNDLKIKDKVMAVAVNMEIVKKENWITCRVKDGDKLEFLHFVGGG